MKTLNNLFFYFSYEIDNKLNEYYKKYSEYIQLKNQYIEEQQQHNFINEIDFKNMFLKILNDYETEIKLYDDKIKFLIFQKSQYKQYEINIKTLFYDDNHKQEYINEQQQKQKKVYVGIYKNNKCFITIDNRFIYSKNDLNLFVIDLYNRQQINKTVKNKFIRYGIIDGLNLFNRIHFKLISLNKKGHKKSLNYLNVSRKHTNKDLLIYDDTNKTTIHTTNHANKLNKSLLHTEINEKIQYERTNRFYYSIINYSLLKTLILNKSKYHKTVY
jgi:hypothetical protein